MAHRSNRIVPFGEIEGTASTNVPAYSSNYTSSSDGGRQRVYGVFTGYRWQCVEFARRWLLMRKTCTFRDVSNAWNMWAGLPYIERVTDGERFRLHPVSNGSLTPPKEDSLLIYSQGPRTPYGHVAIITKVTSDYVYIAEQNNLFHYWPGDYARRQRLRFHNGRYYIEDPDPLFGWMEIENNDKLQPLEESHIPSILPRYLD